MYYIVGLGNPGSEYKKTRHNIGRIILNNFAETNDFSDWLNDKKNKSLVSEGKVEKEKTLLMMPETFMNRSGLSLKNLINKTSQAKKLIVIYDDLDLPFGTFKISFNKNSGGHKGVESIIKNIKTKEFVRIRVGVCPITPNQKLKKPKTQEAILNFIMKDFNQSEISRLNELSQTINSALIEIIQKGHLSAMNKFNYN